MDRRCQVLANGLNLTNDPLGRTKGLRGRLEAAFPGSVVIPHPTGKLTESIFNCSFKSPWAPGSIFRNPRREPRMEPFIRTF